MVKFEDIKSSNIKKMVFSFLSETQALNLIIYNKTLQNIFGVDIEYYKKKSWIYKKAEKNGKGKEYILNKNILIFKGEYLNGKRNGYGNEYNINTGQLSFKGEYLNGKRNGYGKEYYKNGKIKFEGYFLNGKKMDI